jgi:hypothetical protein
MTKTKTVIFCFAVFTCLCTYASVLSDLAAQMRPGDWRELSTTGLTSGFLETRGGDPCCSSILQYADKAVWDPVSEQFFFVGSPHQNPFKFIIYSAATNAWRTEDLPLTCMTTTDLSTFCGSHGYEQNAFDPNTGTFYYKVRSRNVYRYLLDYDRWLQIRPMPDTLVPYPGHANAIEFFPAMGKLAFSTGAGGSGLFLYDTATTQWSRVMAYMNVGFLHNVASYNPVHKVIVYGGGNDNMNFYKVDTSETVTKLADSPVNIRVEGRLFTVDPAGGKHLAFTGSSGFYEYDLLTDTWTHVSGAVPIGSSDRITLVVAAPVTNYGVIMFLRHSNPPKVHLYKHADPIRIERAGPAQGKKAVELTAAPNPFSAQTAFHARLSDRRRVSLKLYSPGGRLVSTLYDGRPLSREMHVNWDGRDRTGQPAAPGLYLGVLKTEHSRKIVKLIIH